MKAALAPATIKAIRALELDRFDPLGAAALRLRPRGSMAKSAAALAGSCDPAAGASWAAELSLAGLSPGTAMGPWHLGQRAVRPACLAAT
jgi:hypothetical protein